MKQKTRKGTCAQCKTLITQTQVGERQSSTPQGGVCEPLWMPQYCKACLKRLEAQ